MRFEHETYGKASDTRKREAILNETPDSHDTKTYYNANCVAND
jgi:hypothetical protein